MAYTHNIANEYATIGGQTVSHDEVSMGALNTTTMGALKTSQ